MKYYEILFDVEWEDGTTERKVHHDTVDVYPTLNGEQILVSEIEDVEYPLEDLKNPDSIGQRISKWCILLNWGSDAFAPRPQFEKKEMLNTDHIERLKPYKIKEKTYEC